MTDQNFTVKDIFTYVRPLSEAFQLVVKTGLDPDELAELDAKWTTVTLPYLQRLNVEGKVRARLEQAVVFAQNRIKSAELEYERSGQTFTKRRYLMEQRIPTAEKFLKLYQSWRDQKPRIRWEPEDVVDIKRLGLDAFISSNLERFYG